MTIFNSLGSNYDFGFVMQSLLANNDKNDHLKLTKFLEEKYGGSASLVYKGREALRLALRAVAARDEKTAVGICGFTCFAVYEAVVKEGLTPVYLDISDDLQFDYETLKAALQKNAAIKIVIIQNTLGFPCDMKKIAKLCREKNIVLIEDLAHSIGTVYTDGREAGTVGDMTVLSFSQDKMIDGISGGALIVRNQKFSLPKSELHKISFKQQEQDRVYPLFTFLIRKTYGLGYGKLLHVFLRKLNLLSKPMENVEGIHALPAWYCKLISEQFQKLDRNITHRKKIASFYASEINPSLRGGKLSREFIDDAVKRSSNLRFPIFVKERIKLIAYLKDKNIYVSDIWYDAPIAPKKYLHKTNYTNQCPNAEKISEQILNLPTHKNVSEADAKFIAEAINVWLKK